MCRQEWVGEHFFTSFLSLVTAQGLNRQARPFMGGSAEQGRGFLCRGLRGPVLPAVGIPAKVPVWALPSGCHSVQGSILS